jgi:hypothetical protein
MHTASAAAGVWPILDAAMSKAISDCFILIGDKLMHN